MRFSFWRRKRRNEELNEEIQAHLTLAEREEMESGQTRKEAQLAARREFGNVSMAAEVTRDVWGWSWLGDLVLDVKYGLRMLRKSPGFTAVAVLTLALGIGANTTIFSWLRAVLLNPLPGAGDPTRVVALEMLAPSGEWTPTSYPDFRDLRDSTKLIESLSVARPFALAVGNERNVERVWGELVSGSYFDLLRVKPERGRFFAGAERDDAQNAHPVAVISHEFWASRYHSDAAVIGTTLRINRFPYTIIGVAPEDFHGSMPGLAFEIWVPATMFGQLSSTGDWMLQDRKTRMFRVLARLEPGIALEQARGEVQSLAARLAQANADTNEGMGATLLPVWKSHYGIQDSLRAPLSVLMGACAVVLLIVCANVTNLLLARAATRRREFSVRLALGASRLRLIRQLLTESLLLAVLGSIAGVFCAAWLGGLMRWLVPGSSIPTIAPVPLDAGVLLFTTALAFAVAVLAGMAPALHAAGENVNETLKEGGRSDAGSARSKRLRGLLVVAETALAVVGLIGAGLFLKSFRTARTIQPGFAADGVALAQFNLSAAGYDAKQADSFCRNLRERLEHQPRVTVVSYADYIPLSLSAGSWEDLEIQGYVPGLSENMKIYRNLVAPGYFSLMKIPLLDGRDFDLRDDASSQPVMIVSQEFVRRFLRNQDPIGVKVHGWGKWFTIVGVAQDSKIYRLTEGATPYFFAPIRQIFRPEEGLKFFVRTSAPVDEAISALRREARAIDPALPVFGGESLDDHIAASLFGQRIAASLLSVLGSLSLFLAAIGLSSVMAYSVAQRTNEIGIRMALGARQADVLRLVVGGGMRMSLAGVGMGLAVSLGLAGAISSLLYGVSASDPATFAAATVLLLGVALAACYVPARRATKVDPMVALRYE